MKNITRKKKDNSVWKIKNKDEFYTNLESMFRENSPPDGLVSGLQYFICVHFNDFNIDFLREIKDKVKWDEVYQKFKHDGKIWILKEDEKMFKEFFGDIEWDV